MKTNKFDYKEAIERWLAKGWTVSFIRHDKSRANWSSDYTAAQAR